jgi:hypothetical protein
MKNNVYCGMLVVSILNRVILPVVKACDRHRMERVSNKNLQILLA